MFEWVSELVRDAGYLGVALLMFAENVFPPIPSELIMPLAGFTAARGGLDLAGVILAGSIGSLAGATFWYLLARAFGHARLARLVERWGRWLTMNRDDLDSATSWFRRHGAKAVLIGRLIPAIRTLISVPAGLAAMPPGRFLAYSSIGTGLWTALLALAGYALESRYELVEGYVDPVSKLVVVAVIAWYAYRVAIWRPRARR